MDSQISERKQTTIGMINGLSVREKKPQLA